MAEQFTNKATTTLNGAINNSTTSVVVTSATGFPTGGNFRIIVKAEGANTDEIMTVTAVAGTTFTVTRASEAIAGVQSASAHASGATVNHVLTAGALQMLPNFIGARVYQNTGQSLTAATETTLLFDTEVFDTDSIHSTSSDTGRLTLPFIGKWRLSYIVPMPGTPGVSFVYVRKNGSTPVPGSESDSGTNQDITLSGTLTVDATVTTDFYELRAYRTGAGNTGNGNAQRAAFEAIYQGK